MIRFLVDWLRHHAELILIALTLLATIALLKLALKQNKREAAREEWTAKFYQAAELAIRIHTRSGTTAWSEIFPAELQGRILVHLISATSQYSTAQARSPMPDKLSMPVMARQGQTHRAVIVRARLRDALMAARTRE
jgi:hypothetical protein